MTKSKRSRVTSRSKNTETCKATASSGQLVCLLESGHTGAHSSASRGKKLLQHATWGVPNADGQLTVTVYARGKRQSEWTEAGPIVVTSATCGAAALQGKPCGLDPGHEGRGEPHSNGVTSWSKDTQIVEAAIEEEEDPRPAWLREQTEQRDAAGRDQAKPVTKKAKGTKHAPDCTFEEQLAASKPGPPKREALTDDCRKCGRELGEHDGKKCPPKTPTSTLAEHDWEKSCLVTQSGRGGLFDSYRCKGCGATSKRYGVRWPPKLDAKQPKKCKTTVQTATGTTAQPQPTAVKEEQRDLIRVGDTGTWCVVVRRGREPQGKIKDNFSESACGDRVYVTATDRDVIFDATLMPPPRPGSALRNLRCPVKTSNGIILTEASLCTACAFAINPHAEEAAAKHRPLTLEDEPADPDGDEAALAAMDPEARAELEQACLQAAAAYDPEEYETRTDDDRELARQQREAREEHARRLDEPAPIAISSPRTSTTVGETIMCRGKQWKIHPAARIFPTPEQQYRALVEGIRAIGQIHPIELIIDDDTSGYQVIDGCSRLRACEELGVEPKTKVVSVVDPYRYVWAVNVDRRHLDESQRAMAAADLANLEHGDNQHTRTGGSAGPPPITQAEAAKLTHASERLTRDAARVKNNAVPEVAQAIRDGKLKVGGGVELAKLGPAKQREILEKVTKGNGEVKSGKVRALVKQEEKREIVRKINTGRVQPMPSGQFGVILADYPWLYDNSDQHDGSRGHLTYATMNMDAIVAHAHEAAKRAAKDAIVALWFTNLYVREIGRVIDAYGAEHRSMVTWVKDRAGVGTWPRGQTEHLVIASIGNPVHTLNEVTTVLHAAVREHSRKPDEAADILAKHCGGPFLELFARGPRKGWTCWGAGADGSEVIKPKLSKIMTATDKRLGAQAPAA